jgi:lipoprotein-anchoring transpeptidase ErfK/SrfK
MRTGVRCVLAVIGAAASVVVTPAGMSLAAANQSHGFAIASISPKRDEVVGVARPIQVKLTAPVHNSADRRAAERAIAVKSTPAMTGRFEWLDDKVVQWVPDRYWPAHSTIALTVGGATAEIKTGPAVIGLASISQHTFTVSIDGVESGPPTSLPAPHHRPHFGEQGVMPASMGRPDYPTPVGTYTVLSKDPAVTMDSSSVGIPVDDPNGYLLTVNYAVRITNRGLFVHSAPWAVSSLGLENVSHGCISLSPNDAEWYYDHVNVGDPVIVQDSSYN